MFVPYLPQKNDNSLFNIWIINIYNIINMKKKFVSDSFFQDFMVFYCRRRRKKIDNIDIFPLP